MNKTAESITPKHPDKICDRISDAILVSLLSLDKNSRVAIETMAGHDQIVVMGEITTTTPKEDVEILIRRNAKRIGGTNNIITNIVKQSPEIAQGVDNGGAGDQGIMVGYACNDNEEMIPQELYLARSLCKYIYTTYPHDGKTQITINENKEIVSIVCSFCNVSREELLLGVNKWLLNQKKAKNGTDIYVNPAGDWSIGGIEADTGLTGRKLICDNYGPQIPVGGGAFSGKDPSKVDRSGAYMARRLAVGFLKELNAQEVIVKIAYAIGKPEPVMLSIVVDGKELPTTANKLTPKNIIETLDLLNTDYEKVAEWGSFGNNFKWD